ncbi:MAG: protein phosphatase 2C domain-containing protein [Acidobacteria bacterium]|nr:protein phosphatase 2C domain-containing protein [Acidobacteriota bacterium]
MASKPASAQLSVGAKTHPGLVRTENQDRMSRFLSPFGELFIVADGMGGHQGGALAAAMTTDGFEKYLRQMPPTLSAREALQECAQRINAEIYQGASSGDPAKAKMGSTVVLALVKSGQMLVGHAGDSRAYLVRQNHLTRLTKDHSAVQKMIDYNMLTEAEARDHPDASVINRAFGQAPEIELEISEPLPVAPGDGLLLCTDGLCGYVDDSEIARAIGQCDDAGKIADTLVELALSAGGEDNVTVQFLQFGARSLAKAGRPLEAQMFSGAQSFAIRSSDDYFPPHAEKQGVEISPQLKYAIVAIGIIAIFALGIWLGTKIEWPPWGGGKPEPTPSEPPSQSGSSLSPKPSNSGGDTQPPPSLQPGGGQPNPGVSPLPTTTTVQTPTPTQKVEQSGIFVNPKQKTEEELKKRIKELEGRISKPQPPTGQQLTNPTTPPSGSQSGGNPASGNPTSGNPANGNPTGGNPASGDSDGANAAGKQPTATPTPKNKGKTQATGKNKAANAARGRSSPKNNH